MALRQLSPLRLLIGEYDARDQVAGGSARWMYVGFRSRRQRPLDSDDFVGTARLFIRPPLPSDAAAIGDTIDDLVISIMGWPVEARDQTLSYVADDRARSGMRILWERTDNRLIGCVDVRPVDPDGIRRTLGMWMGPAHRGRGYMLEALGGLLPALHLRGTDVVEARTAQENVAMQRVLSAVGFMSVAEESHTLPNGAVVDSLLFEKWLIPFRSGLRA